MKTVVEYLGKVSITVEEEEWSIDKAYNRLTIVSSENSIYISRTAVPKGIELTNTKYWKFLIKSENVEKYIEKIKDQLAVYEEEVRTLNGKIDDIDAVIQDRIIDEIDLINGKIPTVASAINKLVDVNSLPVRKGSGTGSLVQENSDKNNKALGKDSVALGTKVGAIGQASYAEGISTNEFPSEITPSSSVANVITARVSTPFNIAYGNASHTEGKDTAALSDYSHAEGESTMACGQGSHAEGANTEANHDYEHAEGRYNKSNTNTRHSVGIGTSESNRKNAFEVMSDGKAFLYDVGEYNGTNPDTADSLQTVIANLLVELNELKQTRTITRTLRISKSNNVDNIIYNMFSTYGVQHFKDFILDVYKGIHSRLVFDVGDNLFDNPLLGDHHTIEVLYITDYSQDDNYYEYTIPYIDFVFIFPKIYTCDIAEEDISFNRVSCTLWVDNNNKVQITNLNYSVE